jgi:hypothetical protein
MVLEFYLRLGAQMTVLGSRTRQLFDFRAHLGTRSSALVPESRVGASVTVWQVEVMKGFRIRIHIWGYTI